jgi:RNAse (barnase) inhibitor barstar
VESIELDGTTWARTDDFYNAYFAAVGAPEWHGRNLDAVWDSLTGGDINQRNLPYRVRIKGTSQMSADARELVGRFQGLVHQAQQAGHSVEVELLP